MHNASKKLTVTGHFDGGNPRPASRIREDEPGVFTVMPTWERSPMHSYGLAFAVMVTNPGAQPVHLTVNVDWGTPEHMQYKGFYYVNREGDEDWTEIKASLSGAVAKVSFDAEPGVSCLSLSPMYNYSTYLAFADALGERTDAEVALAGKSRQGREIWRIQIPPKQASGAEPVVFISRNNACETSGNFMIEGMVRLLLSGTPEVAELTKLFTFHFLPMTNPDGVHDGLERDTAVKDGAWIGRVNANPDPAHDAIRKTLELVRPAVFVNLHNWMMNDVDGLLCNEELYAKRLSELLPRLGKYPRRWHREWYSADATEVEDRGDGTVYPLSRLSELHKESGGTWKDFCRETFGSRAMAVEFPWRGRTVEDMRDLGAALVKVLCAIRKGEREAGR
jgi:hypothetical protein